MTENRTLEVYYHEKKLGRWQKPGTKELPSGTVMIG